MLTYHLNGAGIPIHLSVVDRLEFYYSDKGKNVNTILQDFSSVPAFRNRLVEYGADLGVLIYNRPILSQKAGLAFILSEKNPFAIVAEDSGLFAGGYVFAHEIGHLFGAMHNPEDNDAATWYAALYPYAHGYRQPGEFRTIMSYECSLLEWCSQSGLWSGPKVHWGNTPTGNTSTYDNVRMLTRTAPIVASYKDMTFVPIYEAGSDGGCALGKLDNGKCALAIPGTRIIPFDYDSAGKLNYLVEYTPGPGLGKVWIFRTGFDANPKEEGVKFELVYQSTGLGGFDLIRPNDRMFAFDYDGSGKQDHLVVYRPGTGSIFILKNSHGDFSPVYRQTDPGNGIGGFDLRRPNDRAFAFDYDGTGKQDHLVFYRPGTGSIFILKNSHGDFSPVYAQRDPGAGIGRYDLGSKQDHVFSSGFDDSPGRGFLVLYRPGAGKISILEKR